jgi:Papain fold toxin 1, glutamine deamidase
MSGASRFADLGAFRAAAVFFPKVRKLASTPGREFRARDVEALMSGKHSQHQVEIMRQNHEMIEGDLKAMPDGVPRTVDDVRRVLPKINPLGYDHNCTEASMAVDDVLGGRAAVAGNSRHTDVLPARFGDRELIADDTPASIEKELLQAGDGSRGIAIMAAKDGQGHAANVVNLGGKTYWIDGQLSGLYDLPPCIFDKYPYDELKQGFDTFIFFRTQ